MKILLASTSKHKLSAVRTVVSKLFTGDINVESYASSSAVGEQPVGWEEMIEGAVNRLNSLRVKARKKKTDYDYLIAIENGIVSLEVKGQDRWFDVGIILVENRRGRLGAGFTSSVEMPTELVRKAEKLGFARNTVAKLLVEKVGGDATDPHAILTGGKLTRMDFLSQGLESVLSQLISNTIGW